MDGGFAVHMDDRGVMVRATPIESGMKIMFMDEETWSYYSDMLICRKGFEVECDKFNLEIKIIKAPDDWRIAYGS